MNNISFDTLQQAARKPVFYEKSETQALWTNPHIAEQMLQVHLNTQTDLASYKPETRRAIVDWMYKKYLSHKNADYLDLGCGPGLYTSEIARRGVSTTGVDFSENSINYARNHAQKNNLHITYINDDYLSIKLNKKFDLVTIIWCDFCVLSRNQRSQFLKFVKSVLKPAGVFLFDFHTYVDFIEFQESSNWDYHEGGSFFAPGRNVVLEQHFKYEEEQARCDKFTIISEDKTEELCLWINYYSKEKIENILMEEGFQIVDIFGSLTGDSVPDGAKKLAIAAISK
jgi:2-polyprenyl-3-methyl-5-hydroxy-6-metoxy-1,4-benzoquinol methylase